MQLSSNNAESVDKFALFAAKIMPQFDRHFTHFSSNLHIPYLHKLLFCHEVVNCCKRTCDGVRYRDTGLPKDTVRLK